MDRLGRCHVIAVGAASAWGKTILSPSLEKHGVFNSEWPRYSYFCHSTDQDM